MFFLMSQPRQCFILLISIFLFCGVFNNAKAVIQNLVLTIKEPPERQQKSGKQSVLLVL